jgi:hypothetical protein
MNSLPWEFAIAFIVLACGYFLWRRICRSRADREIAKLLPPSKALTWRSHYRPVGLTALDASREFNDSRQARSAVNVTDATPWSFRERDLFREILPGAADGALDAFAILHSFQGIDPDVLHAVTASTAEHVSGFHSIDHYINDHFFSVGESTAHGFFERLTGYVAEQKAASALEALGHTVRFAEIPNQPIWDLLVDGHPVQIKEGLSGIREFLAEHHGVPVFTGFDNSEALHDPLVHGLHGLDSEGIHNLTQHSLDGLHGSVHGAFHFPIVTFCVSTFREVSLLNKQHTSVEKALFHVALDTGSVGVGAMMGAKAGALAFSVLPGVGTVVGAIIGTIVGGVGGKLFSSHIRFSDFREAGIAYEVSVKNWNAIVETNRHNSEVQVQSISAFFKRKVDAYRSDVLRAVMRDCEFHSALYDDAYSMTMRTLPTVYDDIATLLAEDYQRVFSNKKTSLWRRAFPSFVDHFYRQAKLWFDNAFETIRVERANLAISLPHGTVQAAQIWDAFVHDHTFTSPVLERLSNSLNDVYSHAQEQLHQVRTHAQRALSAFSEEIRKSSATEIEALCNKLAQRLSAASTPVKEARAILTKEGKAVGIVIPDAVNESPSTKATRTSRDPQISWGNISSLDAHEAT